VDGDLGESFLDLDNAYIQLPTVGYGTTHDMVCRSTVLVFRTTSGVEFHAVLCSHFELISVGTVLFVVRRGDRKTCIF
jgi:hypothetical protein